ncbi:hypothetical protein MTO96_023124 [Rhipicephalus appendiculatus]
MFLLCLELHLTRPVNVAWISSQPNGSTVDTVLPSVSGRDFNWTSCPTKNELRAERHFSLWDEKLTDALRRSGTGPPKIKQASWHAVTDNIHAYTAFLASTQERVIYIVSLVRIYQSNANKTKIQHPPLVCVIRTSNWTMEREAHIREVWTWLNPDFLNALIVCPPPDQYSTADGDMEVAVAVRGSAENSLRWLQLHRVPERAQEKCCAVCVRPTYGSSVSLWKIVEFIVHYKLAGVSKFYFYDLKMDSDVKLLLAWLQSNGVDVTLVPFKLIADNAQVHAHAQMPGLYDCIFRSMAKSEYHIHVDFDEFIIPQKHSSIPAMIEEEERKHNGFGSLMIPARYHCAEYPLTMQYSHVGHLPLQTRLFTHHSKDYRNGGFSKYIARSSAVSVAGVHSVRVHHNGYRMGSGGDSMAGPPEGRGIEDTDSDEVRGDEIRSSAVARMLLAMVGAGRGR